MKEFVYKINGIITITTDNIKDAEERINRVRSRLEDTINDVEVELVEEVEIEREDTTK